MNISRTEREKAIEIVRTGGSIMDAHRSTGRAVSSIREWCRAAGVEVRATHRVKGYVRFVNRPEVLVFLKSHTVAFTASRFRYTVSAIREVIDTEAKRLGKIAATRAKHDALDNPPRAVAAEIMKLAAEGREEIFPGVFYYRHRPEDIRRRFKGTASLAAIDRLIDRVRQDRRAAR